MPRRASAWRPDTTDASVLLAVRGADNLDAGFDAWSGEPSGGFDAWLCLLSGEFEAWSCVLSGGFGALSCVLPGVSRPLPGFAAPEVAPGVAPRAAPRDVAAPALRSLLRRGRLWGDVTPARVATRALISDEWAQDSNDCLQRTNADPRRAREPCTRHTGVAGSTP